jgi:hypothetical protein
LARKPASNAILPKPILSIVVKLPKPRLSKNDGETVCPALFIICCAINGLFANASVENGALTLVPVSKLLMVQISQMIEI